MLTKLVKEIMNYESDTFSASDSRVTKHEAQQMLKDWIAIQFENRIDGITLDSLLYELRG